jgi:hypothetical protein
MSTIRTTTEAAFLGDGHLWARNPCGFHQVVHDFETLAEFFDGLGNPIERFGKRLDVLPVQRRYEHLDEFLADGFRRFSFRCGGPRRVPRARCFRWTPSTTAPMLQCSDARIWRFARAVQRSGPTFRIDLPVRSRAECDETVTSGNLSLAILPPSFADAVSSEGDAFGFGINALGSPGGRNNGNRSRFRETARRSEARCHRA